MFKLGDLFEISTPKKRFDANKVNILKSGVYPYIVRTGSCNGQKGFINESEDYLNEGNTISFGQDTATMFYQEKPYFTGDKIKILTAKFDGFNKYNAWFFMSSMKKGFYSFSWGTSSFSVDIIKEQKLNLPVINDGLIDFGFINYFVAELGAERIAELEVYLAVAGLKDYNLTQNEQQALDIYNDLIFDEFKIVDVFDIKNTANILSSDVKENSGNTPYLCASSENNGVKTYISYDKKYLEKGNCIFIGGKTFVVSYQENDFYSNDSHNLILYLRNKSARNKFVQFFLSSCINKSLGGKYFWGDSVSYKKIQDDRFLLPTRGNNPDFSYMSDLISAIQKLVIKDVVRYTEKKMSAYKHIVAR